MKILIYGINGKMGNILYDLITSSAEDTVVAGVDISGDGTKFSCPIYTDCAKIVEKPDCIIDFATRLAIYDYLPYATANAIPCVIAATGHTEEDNRYIKEAAKLIPVFKSGNLSLGINLLIKLSKIAAQILGDKADIEIVEQHHRRKADAPSGTALMIADAVKEVMPDHSVIAGRGPESGKRRPGDIGIGAVRGGTVVGKHEIMFLLDNEVITIKHEAEDRAMFASGGLDAAHFIVKQQNGLYCSNDMFQ